MNINGANTAVKVAEAIPQEVLIPVPPQEKPTAVDVKQDFKSRDDSREESFSSQQARQLAEEMNDIMDDLHTSLGFSIREDLNRQVIVEIKDRETDELIKQIPSEEMLNIKEKMLEFTGLLFDQNV